MSPGLIAILLAGLGFPRVSGDEPMPLGIDADTREFSPRERG